MASNDPSLRRLARQLTSMQKDIRDLQTVPQLAHSSLDDHGMPVYDADGNLTVTIGKQADGTWGAPPVKGPVPPQPAGVEAEGDAGVIRASWQGVFWAGAAKPMDFEAVEVLVDGTVYAGIHDPQGGSVSVPALGGVRTVSFRTLSQAGVVSAAMGHVQVTVEPRVSEQMQELHENLDELNDVTLPELRDDLAGSAEDLQGKLDNLNARVDDLIVDGGGSGNFTTYSINEPSGDGTGEGDQWFRVVNGEVLGQWRWDGSAWQAVTLTDAIIAGIDLSKLVSNGNLSEIVANKMFTDLFAANKITSQEIAAGSITTEKIAAEGIVADVIQGGSFVGETFEGGSFTGGLFKTSDDLPGQVAIADDAHFYPTQGVAGPGIRIVPEDQRDFAAFPGIGPAGDGAELSGGMNTSGESAYIFARPNSAYLRTLRADGSISSNIQANPDVVVLRTVRADGSTNSNIQASLDAVSLRTARSDGTISSTIQASPESAFLRNRRTDGTVSSQLRAGGEYSEVGMFKPNGSNYASLLRASSDEAYMFTSAGGATRYLSVDANGIWVKTNAGGGGWREYNLEETAQDSGWNNFSVSSGITLVQQTAWRNKGGIIWLAGSVRADWAVGAWTSIATLPAALRPSRNIRATAPIDGRPTHLLEINTAGALRLYRPPNDAGGGWAVQVSTIMWPTG